MNMDMDTAAAAGTCTNLGTFTTGGNSIASSTSLMSVYSVDILYTAATAASTNLGRPQELRDRFTKMRVLDLAVQNNTDLLDKKAHLFFKQCKRDELQNESMDTEFQSLRGEYLKCQPATPGAGKRRETICTLPAQEERTNLNHSLPVVATATSPSQPRKPRRLIMSAAEPPQSHPAGGRGRECCRNCATATYNLQQRGGGVCASSAIATAASQALLATQQMQQERRTSTLRASYEAIHETTGTTAEFWLRAGQS
ncbi:inhibitor of growth protein 3-like [Drosophila serrata]|uniref:inhibitor of growth protein 3-like n=1 Tax=Drosophila serrata TaxID=7274 RepID=UPI000A1D2C14|nr:inhibitor of growth protein 3-like [Drosophila serrata]